MSTNVTIDCPAELVGFVDQFRGLNSDAQKAAIVSNLSTLITVAMIAQAEKPRVPLTEPQQVVYDMIEERGIVKLDDLVAHLDRLGVTVDRSTVQRWCGQRNDKPGPLRRAGVRSCRKGYYVSQRHDLLDDDFDTKSA